MTTTTETALRKGLVRVGDYLPIPQSLEMTHRLGDTYDLLHGYRGTVVILHGRECYKISYSPFQSLAERRRLARILMVATGQILRPRWYVRWFRAWRRERR